MSEPLALLGTSADPPTLGHQTLLLELLERYPRVVTWASDNPHKQHGATLKQRAQLLAALVEQLNNPRLEHVQELSSPWAITTLERAEQHWPGSQLVFVVGSDLVSQIPAWKQVQQVLQRCQLVLVPRAGWPLERQALATLERLGGEVSVLNLPIPATASSRLRQRPDAAQIPASVWPLLREHNLYGLGSPS